MQTARSIAFKITPAIKQEMVKIIDARIREAHVTKEDFSELKNIVKDIGVKVGELAQAQKRTEVKVEELAEAQKDLAEAQKRTELRLEELATAQKELTEAQKRTEMAVTKLVERADTTNTKLGGLDRSIGYAFENEAYRHLPEILKSKYGIEIKEKIIRTRIGGHEIDLLGHAIREGREILVVGEAKTKLDERKEQPEVFAELEDKVQAVLTEYPQAEIVRVLVTHFAREGFLDKAKEKGIIVVQSFEW